MFFQYLARHGTARHAVGISGDIFAQGKVVIMADVAVAPVVVAVGEAQESCPSTPPATAVTASTLSQLMLCFVPSATVEVQTDVEAAGKLADLGLGLPGEGFC